MLEITGKKAEPKEKSPLGTVLMKRKMKEIIDRPGLDRPRFGSEAEQPPKWPFNYMHNDMPDAT